MVIVGIAVMAALWIRITGTPAAEKKPESLRVAEAMPAAVSPTLVSAATVSSLAGGTVKNRVMSLTATVEDVDAENRAVTLRSADGTSFTVAMAPEVDDLGGFERGDEVSLTYRQSVAFRVEAPDEASPGVAHTRDVTRPSHSGDRGGSVTDTVDIRAPIAAIDKAASAVTVRNLRGDTAVVEMPDADALDAMAVGDVLDIAVTSALTITVSKAP